MLSYAMYLFNIHRANKVFIYPDPMHAKNYDFCFVLNNRGFEKVESFGGTDYAGRYRHGDGREVIVNPTPGKGDVTAVLPWGTTIFAEAKGGWINTTHPGRVSNLRRRVQEAIGQLMSRPSQQDEKQVAVVPRTQQTEELAKKLSARVRAAGIEIALVDERGNVLHI